MNQREKIPRFIMVFIALYPILPNYFAINLSDELPLISVSRILLVLLIFLTLINKKSPKKYILSENRKIFQKSKIYIILYFLSQLIVSLANLTGSALNNVFCLILENILLLYCLVSWVNTPEKVEKALKIIIITSGIVCLLAIIEPFTNVNLAYYLDFAHRATVLKAGYLRGGILRAEFSFGHPIALGMYVLLVFPFTMYFCGKTKKIRYYIISILNIFAVVLSSSRTPIAVLAGIFIISMFMADKETRKSYAKLMGVACLGTILLSFFSSGFFSVVQYNIGQVLAVVGLGSATDELNSISVRTAQWSVLKEVLNNNPIVGAGIGYINDNIVYYINSNGNWGIMQSVDCEYLEQIIEGGIIGISGYVSLLYVFIKNSMSKRNRRKSRLYFIFFISFFGYFIGYITVSELRDQMLWIMFALFYSLMIFSSNPSRAQFSKYDKVRMVDNDKIHSD